MTLPLFTATTEEELLAKLTRPTTRGAGRPKNSHGYQVWQQFIESGAPTATLTYANEEEAKKNRLSLTKEMDALNVGRDALSLLWVSPREGNLITIADLGKMNDVQAKAAILTQVKQQQDGVAQRYAPGTKRENPETVKEAQARSKSLEAAIKKLNS